MWNEITQNWGNPRATFQHVNSKILLKNFTTELIFLINIQRDPHKDSVRTSKENQDLLGRAIA
jgi:hypothetical protein